MSALDYINDKTPPFLGLENPMTALEFAIWFTDRGTTAVDMNIAAAELAAKDARIAKLEAMAVIAESVNQWLIQNELGNTAHQLQLAKSLQETQ